MLRQGTFLNAIPSLEDLKAVRQLYKREKETLSMEILYDRKAVRQEIAVTIFKDGTKLP